jgi:hypothetical protein
MPRCDSEDPAGDLTSTAGHGGREGVEHAEMRTSMCASGKDAEDGDNGCIVW